MSQGPCCVLPVLVQRCLPWRRGAGGMPGLVSSLGSEIRQAFVEIFGRVTLPDRPFCRRSINNGRMLICCDSEKMKPRAERSLRTWAMELLVVIVGVPIDLHNNLVVVSDESAVFSDLIPFSRYFCSVET